MTDPLGLPDLPPPDSLPLGLAYAPTPYSCSVHLCPLCSPRETLEEGEVGDERDDVERLGEGRGGIGRTGLEECA
jgi:hypothetical protein